MAIVSCSECGASVSTGARSCPRCGHDATDECCGTCTSYDSDFHECMHCDKGYNSTACPGYSYDDPTDW